MHPPPLAPPAQICIEHFEFVRRLACMIRGLFGVWGLGFRIQGSGFVLGGKGFGNWVASVISGHCAEVPQVVSVGVVKHRLQGAEEAGVSTRERERDLGPYPSPLLI